MCHAASHVVRPSRRRHQGPLQPEADRPGFLDWWWWRRGFILVAEDLQQGVDGLLLGVEVVEMAGHGHQVLRQGLPHVIGINDQVLVLLSRHEECNDVSLEHASDGL